MTKSKILFVLMIGIFALSTVMSSCKKDDKDEPTKLQLKGTTWVENTDNYVFLEITFTSSIDCTVWQKMSNGGATVGFNTTDYTYNDPDVIIGGRLYAGTVSGNTMTLTDKQEYVHTFVKQ